MFNIINIIKKIIIYCHYHHCRSHRRHNDQLKADNTVFRFAKFYLAPTSNLLLVPFIKVLSFPPPMMIKLVMMIIINRKWCDPLHIQDHSTSCYNLVPNLGPKAMGSGGHTQFCSLVQKVILLDSLDLIGLCFNRHCRFNVFNIIHFGLMLLLMLIICLVNCIWAPPIVSVCLKSHWCLRWIWWLWWWRRCDGGLVSWYDYAPPILLVCARWV